MHHLVGSVVISVVLVYLWWKWRTPRKVTLDRFQLLAPTKRLMNRTFSPDTTFQYRNGDTATLNQIYKNEVASDSVFSPYNSQWFFNFSGLNSFGEVIFSSSMHQFLTMRNSLPPFQKIKKWQITLGTSLTRTVPEDVWDGLTII